MGSLRVRRNWAHTQETVTDKFTYNRLLTIWVSWKGRWLLFSDFSWEWPCVWHLMIPIRSNGTSPVAQMVKKLPAMQETWVWSLGWQDPLQKGKATHSSTLAWKIPQTEEPGGLQFTGSQRVRHDLACRHIKSNGPTCQSFFVGVQICHTLWSKNKKDKPHEY